MTTDLTTTAPLIRLGVQRQDEPTLTQVLARLADHLDGSAMPIELAAFGTAEWMDTEGVANYLQVSVKAVRQAANRGDLPGHKFPPNRRQGRWRFRKDDIDKAMCKRRPTPKRKGLTAW